MKNVLRSPLVLSNSKRAPGRKQRCCRISGCLGALWRNPLLDHPVH